MCEHSQLETRARQGSDEGCRALVRYGHAWQSRSTAGLIQCLLSSAMTESVMGMTNQTRPRAARRTALPYRKRLIPLANAASVCSIPAGLFTSASKPEAVPGHSTVTSSARSYTLTRSDRDHVGGSLAFVALAHLTESFNSLAPSPHPAPDHRDRAHYRGASACW